MNQKLVLLALCFGVPCFGLSACGAADDPSHTTPAPRAAADPDPAAVPNPMPVAATVAGPDWVPNLPELDNPSLTVRVAGPTPVDADVSAPSGPFETRVLVTNEGDEAALVQQAHVAFDVWSSDGERNACTRQGDPGPAPRLDPGEAHELRVVAVCTLPEPGIYEVRTYVSFAAEAVDGSLEVERYFAGRREIRVQ